MLGAGSRWAIRQAQNYRAIQAEIADLPVARQKILEKGLFQAKALLTKEGRPRTAEGYCLLALATDSLRGSLPLVRKALEIDPRNREALALLVRLHDVDHTVMRSREQHRSALQEEISDFSLVARDHADYAGALYRLGAARLELLRVGGPVSNIVQAESELEQARGIVESKEDPATTALVYYQLGRLQNLRAAQASASSAPQFRTKSIQYLRRATELNPSHVETWAELARTLRTTGEASGALASLEDAAAKLKSDQDRARLWSLIGALYLENKEPEKAVQAMQTGIRLDPASPGPYLGLAAMERSAGKPKDAEKTLEACLKAVPNLIEAETMLSRIYFQTSRQAEAVRILEQAVGSAESRSLAPGDQGQRMARYQALASLAYLYLNSQNRPADARRALEFAMRLREPDAEVLDLWGWVHHRLGDNQRALSILNELVGRAPGYALAHFHLAQIHEERKDTAKALAELDKALSTPGQFPERRNAEAMRARLAGRRPN